METGRTSCRRSRGSALCEKLPGKPTFLMVGGGHAGRHALLRRAAPGEDGRRSLKLSEPAQDVVLPLSDGYGNITTASLLQRGVGAAKTEGR
ncbi:hypothetical protein [Desulfothermobacter acidiphilus]|uniref:hypothetical protein n=1 Tax=Desulfothermobacter acidiphilus TaxID=1938353 RepID=UPI003F8AC378